jgi:hypothetical protein
MCSLEMRLRQTSGVEPAASTAGYHRPTADQPVAGSDQVHGQQRLAVCAGKLAVAALIGAVAGTAVSLRWMSERATLYVLAAILLLLESACFSGRRQRVVFANDAVRAAFRLISVGSGGGTYYGTLSNAMQIPRATAGEEATIRQMCRRKVPPYERSIPKASYRCNNRVKRRTVPPGSSRA